MDNADCGYDRATNPHAVCQTGCSGRPFCVYQNQSRFHVDTWCDGFDDKTTCSYNEGANKVMGSCSMADVAVWAPEGKWQVPDAAPFYKCGYNCFPQNVCPTAATAGFQKEPCDGWDKITMPCGNNETICSETTAACRGGIWCEQGKYPPCKGGNCTCEVIPQCAAANAPTPAPAVAVAGPLTNSWKNESSMPGPRIGCGMVEAGGATPKLYVVTGSDGYGTHFSNKTYVYDPPTKTWSTLPYDLQPSTSQFDSGRMHAGVTVVKNVIFVVGGTGEFGGQVFDTIESFDTKNEPAGWTLYSSKMKEARTFLGVTAAFNDGVIATGGYPTGSPNGRLAPLSSVEVFNTTTKEWVETALPGMTQPRGGHAATSIFPGFLTARRGSAEHLWLQQKRRVAQLRHGFSLSLSVLRSYDRCTSAAATCATGCPRSK